MIWIALGAFFAGIVVGVLVFGAVMWWILKDASPFPG